MLPGRREGRAPQGGGRESKAEAEVCRVQSRCLADQGRWRAACPMVGRCEAEGGAAGPGGLRGGRSLARLGPGPGETKTR